KTEGDLFNNVDYLNAITVSNGKSQEDIDSVSSFVQNTTGSSRPVENDFYKLTFDNDSEYPYYDGSLNPFDTTTSTWTAPYKMEIELVVSYVFAIASSSYSNRVYIYINGVFTFVDVGLDVGGLYNTAYVGDDNSMTMTRRFTVEAGDTIEIYTQGQQSSGSTQNDVVSGTLKITPTFIYKFFGNKLLPDWTQQQYVSNILKIFSCIPVYDSSTKTLTIDLFDKIKEKRQIDISQYVDTIETDFVDVISVYAKNNYLSFQEIDIDDDFRETKFDYAKGVIVSNNEFLEDKADIIESDFSNPISYINSVFDMSIEKTDLITLDSGESTTATAVTDSSGARARFTIADDVFLISDLVRIEDSTNPAYSGDWKIYTLGAGYVEFTGLQFYGNATARLTKMSFSYTENDSVFLLRHVPLYTISKFSGLTSFKVENADLETISFAYFHLINTGRQVNKDFIFSFSFWSSESDSLQYQISLIDRYFRVFSQILNDPVKLFASCYFPKSVYESITFLNPVMIKTVESTNMYYVNRITGYK